VLFLGLSLLAYLFSLCSSCSALASNPGIETALLYVSILNLVVIVAIVCEEALHAVTVVQCAGQSALRGVATRRGSWLGIPIPLAIGVVYAPWLGVRERSAVAAGGALGSGCVVGLLALIIFGTTGDAAAFWLMLVPGVNLLPLRRLAAIGFNSDGDALLDAFVQLRPGIRAGLGLLLRPLSRALVGSLTAATTAPANSIDVAGPSATPVSEKTPVSQTHWSENHG